ncbi:hypothetical protein DYB28_001461 [Aphanomyces astaci]|uniref:Uncharacterized protein n=1 Tax=Aphanomyces astaci TaxID=112090 RepID=A0A9X8H667_APHAT|nr:hypothetical protein DYB28_001461 [Aphanomyces astaci]
MAWEEAVKQAIATEEAKTKAKRAEEAKVIAAVEAKAADEAAKEATEAANKMSSGGCDWDTIGGKQGKVSVVGAAVKIEAKLKGEFGGPERTGLA